MFEVDTMFKFLKSMVKSKLEMESQNDILDEISKLSFEIDDYQVKKDGINTIIATLVKSNSLLLQQQANIVSIGNNKPLLWSINNSLIESNTKELQAHTQRIEHIDRLIVKNIDRVAILSEKVPKEMVQIYLRKK